MLLNFIIRGARETPRKNGVASVAPSLLEDSVLADILDTERSEQSLMQQTTIALVSELAMHHRSLALPAANILGPLLRLVLKFASLPASSSGPDNLPYATAIKVGTVVERNQSWEEM